MRLTTSVLFGGVLLTIFIMRRARTEDNNEYLQERHRIRKVEKLSSLGGNIRLSSKENEANKLILQAKQAELDEAYKNASAFLPSQHFFQAKNKMEQSKVFWLISKLPKAGSLHTHLLAGVSVDFIMSKITHRENLYGCFINNTFKLRFLKEGSKERNCDWKSLKNYRKEDQNFDGWLRKQLTLEVENPAEAYPSPESVWQRFKKIFTTLYDMICYRPVFELYINQLLEELYKDNVMYVEVRGTFMPLYELDGTVYDRQKFFEIFINTVDEFKIRNPKFIGVRYIHSIYRGVSVDALRTGLSELIEVQTQFADFIAGFDFVGYEEEGNQLVDYSEVLLEVRGKVKFFFHAGETNWYGYTDLNLIDAVLLNTSRIGHGFALPKHPIIMDLARNRKIPVEVCPISNQVLMLNQDPRNHPAGFLIANGFPLVICNDDPSVWGATGLSYDWYVVFMAMTSRDAGIEKLKQFALNSILYSAMNSTEKSKALEEWNKDWQIFIGELLRTEML